jgi:hypothetical protein
MLQYTIADAICSTGRTIFLFELNGTSTVACSAVSRWIVITRKVTYRVLHGLMTKEQSRNKCVLSGIVE